MPNIPKKPNDKVLEIIDRDIQYFPVSGKLIWVNKSSSRASKAIIGKEIKTNNRGYYSCKILNKTIKAHHMAWYKFYGEWPEKELDHKDRNKQNNAILNLRKVTKEQNNWNTKCYKNNLLNEKGIRFVPHLSIKNPYMVRANRSGKYLSKYVASLQEAITIRDSFYQEHEKWQ